MQKPVNFCQHYSFQLLSSVIAALMSVISMPVFKYAKLSYPRTGQVGGLP